MTRTLVFVPLGTIRLDQKVVGCSARYLLNPMIQPVVAERCTLASDEVPGNVISPAGCAGAIAGQVACTVISKSAGGVAIIVVERIIDFDSRACRQVLLPAV